jgi:purine-binding chemotaxis protein CheW
MSQAFSEKVPLGPWATFSLAQETFAVSAEDVQEVMIEQPLTPVPLAPGHIIGLLNLRGQIMPAIDLRKRLKFEPKLDGKESSYIVLRTRDSVFSIVVDSIGDVLELKRELWEQPPETLTVAHRAFVFGICPIGSRVLLGLRAEALSGDADIKESAGAQ